jgi:TolA-binding protein
MANSLLEPALADLRQVVADFPESSAAAEAAFLSAGILEKLGRTDDAMAAHIEFARRFAGDRRMAASRLRLAELTARSRRPNREEASRDLLAQVIATYPGTPEAFEAFQLKLRLDGERRPRERDPVLGIMVPAIVPTLRAFTEQFPRHPSAMTAFSRLADAYVDLGQFERAAEALIDLATNFPNNPHDAWFRAGELYERRLKDLGRARQAYEKVPEGSSRYRDAQRRLKGR